MQTIRKKLSELHKTEKNIRRHSGKQIEEYVRSLKMFGQIRPLVVTEDGEILVGNGMFEALNAMGETECDVYVVSGLSKAQKRKLMLADNKVYELGITTTDLLDDILSDLNGDFDVPGYDSELLATISANVLEADDLVTDYGTEAAVVVQPTQERHENDVVYAQQPASQYEPPVKQADGGFANPEQEAPKERAFVICPHCGEKVWL